MKISEDMLSFFLENSFMVGDAAYPLRRFLLTLLKDNDTQKRYNNIHSSTRNITERAFGLSKSKFSRSRKIYFKNIKEITLLAVAMYILHNFCLDEGYGIGDVDVSVTDQEANGFVCIGSSWNNEEAKRKKS